MGIVAERKAEQLILRSARSVRSVEPLVHELSSLEGMQPLFPAWEERGYLDPREDEALWRVFASYLTARAVLLEATAALRPIALGPPRALGEATQLRAFAVGYAAACELVAAGRRIVGGPGAYDVVRRKLNEARPQLGIPRKQFIAIYRSLTDPGNAWSLLQAKKFAGTHAAELRALATDPELAPMLAIVERAQGALDLALGEYVRQRARYRLASWLRRNRSAVEQATFWVLEGGGRFVARLRPSWHRKLVTEDICRQLAALLQSGDVIVTRHHDAPSNLFLPGYWPHAALYLGPPETIASLGLSLDADRAARWCGGIDVLEAKRDGVLFRQLAETLSVDAVAIIRPLVNENALARSLERAIQHEGKLFDFSFDFTRSDRVVCTEVVYRAYHEPGTDLGFELLPRSGRLTVSAEQLLDMAVEGQGFRVVGLFGTPDSRKRVLTGSEAREALIASYRRQ